MSPSTSLLELSPAPDIGDKSLYEADPWATLYETLSVHGIRRGTTDYRFNTGDKIARKAAADAWESSHQEVKVCLTFEERGEQNTKTLRIVGKDVTSMSCECKDFRESGEHGKFCKHIVAVMLKLLRQEVRLFRQPPIGAEPPRVSGPQGGRLLSITDVPDTHTAMEMQLAETNTKLVRENSALRSQVEIMQSHLDEATRSLESAPKAASVKILSATDMPVIRDATIRTAKLVRVYVYTSNDPEFKSSLRRSGERGADVKILASTARVNSSDSMKHYLESLLSSGIQIRLLDKPTIHSKALFTEKSMIVGSANYTIESQKLVETSFCDSIV